MKTFLMLCSLLFVSFAARAEVIPMIDLGSSSDSPLANGCQVTLKAQGAQTTNTTAEAQAICNGVNSDLGTTAACTVRRLNNGKAQARIAFNANQAGNNFQAILQNILGILGGGNNVLGKLAQLIFGQQVVQQGAQC